MGEISIGVARDGRSVVTGLPTGLLDFQEGVAAMLRRTLLSASVTGAGLCASVVFAQGRSWPNRPIRVVVPYAPGGATDAMARLAAQKLQEKLGVTVVVDNRAGANGTIGADLVRQAAPDGYTLLGSDATHPTSRLVMRNVPYDPVADFVLIARTARAPVLLSIDPRLPVRSIEEMVAAVRAAPDRWTFAVSSMGAPATMASIEFNRRFGTQMELVLYRGAAPAVADVVGGSVPAIFAVIPSVLPLVRSGQLRALAIAATERSPLAPDILPTGELGLPDFEFNSWYGVWGPRGLPTDIAEQLNRALTESMAEPDMVRQLASMGFEPVVQSVADAQRFIEADLIRNAALLRSANFEPQ
ncbi:tripartite tricarboxylate transporter substrate binding protein [Roseomonas sp. CAU 1739]